MIEFTGNLVFNVEEVDEQHQELIRMINELDKRISDGTALSALTGIIDALIDYTSYHFSTEEAYFKKFGFSHEVSHVNEHRIFVERVLQFDAALKSGKNLLPHEMMQFLREWLLQHISIVDRKYVDCFKQNGL